MKLGDVKALTESAEDSFARRNNSRRKRDAEAEAPRSAPATSDEPWETVELSEREPVEV